MTRSLVEVCPTDGTASIEETRLCTMEMGKKMVILVKNEILVSKSFKIFAHLDLKVIRANIVRNHGIA